MSRPTTDPPPAIRSGRPTGSASSLHREGRATRSCSGARRTEPAATSGSSPGRKSHEPARQRLVARRQRAPVYRGGRDQRDRADSHQGPVRREGAGEQRLTIGYLPRRTLDGLPGLPVRSNRDLCGTVSRTRNSATNLGHGGRLPIWSPNGRELFFSSLDARRMLAVPVQPGARSSPGVRRCCSNS